MAKGSKISANRTAETWRPLADNRSDRDRAEGVPRTPQSTNPSYRLAYVDDDFLCREELRPIRLQLELLKPEMILAEHGIKSTVVMFGGARIPAPGTNPWAAKNEVQRKHLKEASKYYEEAEKFARLCSQASADFGYKEFVIVTGGGPGVMEAGNKGADSVGAPSIGLNIVLPHEQAPNAFVTPDLSFNFHYFAIRKMHFMLRARAVTCFPGGFGTLDELFETLTLIQTGRMARIPLILFGEAFWKTIINFQALADFGTISPDDVKLVHFVETAEKAWEIIATHYQEETGGAPGF